MIKLEDVSKVYRSRNGDVRALDRVNLGVERGEFVVIRGPSGSGKSTLLLTIGGLIRPTRGKVLLDGKDLYGMGSGMLAGFRAKKVGFVFQMFHLLPYLNVIENVLVPTTPGAKSGMQGRARELLEELQMSGRLHHRPSQLSTGERQRVAIARALLNKPSVILADEPTGNLDPDNAAHALGYLAEFHKEGGTVVLVTHEKSAEDFAEKTFVLDAGRLSVSREGQ
jgi:putative ABC transport system ATP-binding protein